MGQSPGAADMDRMSRPPSQEIPVIKESPSPSQVKQVEFGQPKGMQHLYDLLNKANREIISPHRPASAQSEPGLVPYGVTSGRRSLSPNVHAQSVNQQQSTMNGSGKMNKPACVRDLIHSAIERNLGQTDPKGDPRPPMMDRPIDKRKLVFLFFGK
jgi:hypothetical protein